MRRQLLFFTLLTAVSISACRREIMTTGKISRASGEAAQEARERVLWEKERLMDPAIGAIPPMIREKELAFAATLPDDRSAQARRVGINGDWNFRGPWNVGGRTRALAIDVTNENVLLAGGVSGGMWRSTDGGNSWSRVSDGMGHPGVNAIAQDTRPGREQTWYYLSGEAYGTSASGGSAFYLGNGMYKSGDGGRTWASLSSTVSGTPHVFDNVWDVTWNVVTDPGNLIQDVVYGACFDAIYKSVNGGTSWSLVRGNAGVQSTYSYFTDVAVSPTSVVYATLSSDGPQKGIWRAPGGTGFVNILPSNFPPNYDRLVIGIDPNNENIVYFFGPTPGYGRMSTDFQGDTLWNSLWKYEYLSGNGTGTGGTWTDLSPNLPGNIGVFNGLNTQGGYDLVVKVKPGNSNVVFIGGTNFFRSDNAFADSTQTTVIGGYALGAALPFVDEYPGHHPDQHALVFLPSNPDIMYAGCDGGVSKTLDNTASNVVWEEKNLGYITSQFYTVTLDHGGNSDVIIGGLQDNGTYYSNDTSATADWYHSFDGDGSYCQITDGGSYYYFSKQQGKIAKTTVDPSGQVTAYRRIDPIGAENYQFINPFVLDPNNQDVMYLCAGQYIWRNDDLSGIPLSNQWDSIATNWVRLPDTLPTAGEEITALAISRQPAHRLYYGTNKRHIYRLDSANTGVPQRVDITYSLFPASGYTSCIAVNPQNADELLVVFSNYGVYSLFHSSDAGANWRKVGGNLEQNTGGTGNGPSCRWASILPVSDGTVYLVGTSVGLFAADTLITNSTVWVRQGSTTIGTAVVDMLDCRESDGLVAVATHGNGVYTARITSINDITTGTAFANRQPEFSLFPNPARDRITLQVASGTMSRPVHITLLDELGRELRSLSANSIDNLTLDVADLHAGLYYVRLQDELGTQQRAFIRQ